MVTSTASKVPVGFSSGGVNRVLRGKLELELDGERFLLGPGDSITFPGRTAHTYRNPSGRERCEALLAIAPAS